MSATICMNPHGPAAERGLHAKELLEQLLQYHRQPLPLLSFQVVGVHASFTVFSFTRDDINKLRVQHAADLQDVEDFMVLFWYVAMYFAHDAQTSPNIPKHPPNIPKQPPNIPKHPQLASLHA